MSDTQSSPAERDYLLAKDAQRDAELCDSLSHWNTYADEPWRDRHARHGAVVGHALAHLRTAPVFGARAVLEILGCDVTPLDEGAREAADAAAEVLVWTCEADDFEIGDGDLDNRHHLVGVYATLGSAARELAARVERGERIYNAELRQTVVI